MSWIAKQDIDAKLAELISGKTLPLGNLRKRASESYYRSTWKNMPFKSKDAFAFKTTPSAKIKIETYLPDGMQANPRMVFVDGVFDAASSLLSDKKGVSLCPLSASQKDAQEHLENLTITQDKHYETKLLHFNSAFFEDGALVSLESGVTVEETILLVFVSTSAAIGKICAMKNFITLGDSAKANITEIYIGDQGTSHMTNVFSHIHLAENANLEHSKLQLEGPTAVHYSGITSIQEKHSELRCLSTAFGSSFSSLDTLTTLKDGSSCNLSGLYFGKQAQKLNHYTCIDHAEPHSTSQELYKGIMDHESVGDFTGKIIVRPNAQKIDSKQLSRNLLLSKSAVANATPQLEIFADDVKCSHGATIGELDDQEIFYLRSRGLSMEQAKRELITAYAEEVVQQHQDPRISDYLSKLLSRRMAQET